MKSLLNTQSKSLLMLAIKSELTAANTYKYLANHMQRLAYFGMQKYFIAESESELNHYQRIVDFINDMGDVADMPAIEEISEDINDIGEALTIAYEMELGLLNQYKDFYNQIEEQDITIAQFLLQFIEIQRKAVGEYNDLLVRYDIANKTNEILLFDKLIE